MWTRISFVDNKKNVLYAVEDGKKKLAQYINVPSSIICAQILDVEDVAVNPGRLIIFAQEEYMVSLLNKILKESVTDTNTEKHVLLERNLCSILKPAMPLIHDENDEVRSVLAYVDPDVLVDKLSALRS